MTARRIVAAVTGVLGLVGLGFTLLPLLTVNMDDRITLFAPGWYFGGFDYDELCSEVPDLCTPTGTIAYQVGFLDFGAFSVVPAVGFVPIVLGLVAAAGALQAWRGPHRGGATTVALLSLGAVLVALFTAFTPTQSIRTTGELATFSGPSALSPELAVTPGAGLIGASIALVLILALSTWQSIMDLLARR